VTVQRDLFTVSGHEVPQRVVEDVANELSFAAAVV
jgi:hypothetical protein